MEDTLEVKTFIWSHFYFTKGPFSKGITSYKNYNNNYPRLSVNYTHI